MMRTQISLDVEERRLLDAEVARTGRSISALIRDAVSRTYGPGREAADDVSAIESALGAWSEREIDGGSYVEAFRSGSRWEESGAR